MSGAPLSPSAAIEDVVSRLAHLVRGVASRYRLTDVDVDELTQEVRVRLWRVHGDDGEKIYAVSASYLYHTATSAAIDLMRRRRTRRADACDSDPEVLDRMVGPGGPEQDLASSEFAATVARAIDTIPVSRRAVVRMYLAGYPRDEIATLLGWTEPKTRNLIYRGLDDLRERLTGWGLDPKGRDDR